MRVKRNSIVKRHVLLGVVGVLLVGAGLNACASEEIHGTATMANDYLAYSTVEELVEAADVIVEGRHVSSTSDIMMPSRFDSDSPIANPHAGVAEEDLNLEDHGIVVTVAKFRIDRVLLGDLEAGDVIEVRQSGGVVDNFEFVDPAGALIEAADGETLTLSLMQFDDGILTPLNLSQGVLVVHDDGSLRPISEEGAIPGLEGLTTSALEAAVGNR